jgi:hypothetical protein
VTIEFVDDPIVPLELRLPGGRRYVTLYQPGWFTASDGSRAFLGRDSTLYGFATVEDLVAFVDSGAPHDLTRSPHLRTLRTWTVEEYTRRLCSYDFAQLPELRDDRLDTDEQASLGSTLAVMLDLLDYTDVTGEHADALREDDDIGKLASGDEVLSIFRAAHHRQHVVDLLRAHWSACVEEVSRRVTTPEIPADPPVGGPWGNPAGMIRGDDGDTNADDAESTPLETVADAVTLWFGLADEGVYVVRSTTLHGEHPAFGGTRTVGSPARLFAWTDLDQMKADLAGGLVDESTDGVLDLAGVAARADVDLTPHDDCIFDLVELADSIDPAMDQDAADRLVCAWTELLRLAAWGGWSDVTRLLEPVAPAGTFMISCAIDVAQDRPGARRALTTADVDAAVAGWRAVIPALTAHLEIRRR